MKKLLALMLAAALALSLVACGGGGGTGDNTPSGGGNDTPSPETMSVEEMLEMAHSVTIDALRNDYNSNVVNAKDKYEGNYYVIPGYVWDITEDYCDLSLIWSIGVNENFIRAYLSTDDLKQIAQGEFIKVVGVIGEIEDEDEDDIMFGTVTKRYFHLDNAHYVSDISEIGGVVKKETNMINGYVINRVYIEMPITTKEPQKILIDDYDTYGISDGDNVIISDITLKKFDNMFSSDEYFLVTLNQSAKVEIIENAE